MLPNRVAPSQVHESGDSLGNWSGDASREVAIRWKNGVRTLQGISPSLNALSVQHKHTGDSV